MHWLWFPTELRSVGGGGSSQDTNSLYAWWSYLERGHGRVPAIPVYGVELGGVVEFMVQFRVSFASVHHFLEGKEEGTAKNELKRKRKEEEAQG